MSELSEPSMQTPDTGFSTTPPQQLSIVTSSELVTESFGIAQLLGKSIQQQIKTSLVNSSNSESPNVASPKAVNKSPLSKIVNETVQKEKVSNDLLKVEEFDLAAFVGNGYEPIEENVYLCKKY